MEKITGLVRKITIKQQAKGKDKVEVLPSSSKAQEIKDKLKQKGIKLNEEQKIKENIKKREQEKKLYKQIETQQDKEDIQRREQMKAQDKMLRENSPFYKAITKALKELNENSLSKSKSNDTLFKKSNSNDTLFKKSKSKDSFDSILKLY